ncbi:MAG: DUF4278 domain-containing protein [Leptolyngbyaceae bacterium]|nr:DUF4278 domain-containing protein [Leptolyngbyaceae bacterium]
MKLRFLGTEYDCSTEAMTASEGPVGGKYRGAEWRTKQYNVAPRHQSDVTLHYRGRAYRSDA